MDGIRVRVVPKAVLAAEGISVIERLDKLLDSQYRLAQLELRGI